MDADVDDDYSRDSSLRSPQSHTVCPQDVADDSEATLATVGTTIDEFLAPGPLLTRAEVVARPCPIPAVAGVYGWWFDRIPDDVPVARCVHQQGSALLYVGISPKSPPRNGAPSSHQTIRSRVRYHYTGNAEGSTLRLTLGVLLASELGIELRRVGSGRRRTFATGEQALSAWMADHARVSYTEHPEPWLLEEELIAGIDLPLNLDQNRHNPFHAELSRRRSDAKAAAGLLPVLPR
jgi:hypothetical protein